MASTDRDLIEMMAKNEDAIGELYLAFSNCFPDDAEFWIRLDDVFYRQIVNVGQKIPGINLVVHL